MGGGGGDSTTQAVIPDILKPLYQQTANMMMDYQSNNPLGGRASWTTGVGGGGQGGGYGSQGGNTGWGQQGNGQGNQNPGQNGGYNGQGDLPAAGSTTQQNSKRQALYNQETGEPIDDSQSMENQGQRQGQQGGKVTEGGDLGNTNPYAATGGSRYMSNYSNGPQHGGDYGFSAPNAKQIAGLNGQQEAAMNGLNWMRNNQNPWISRVSESANQLGNRADNMFGADSKYKGQGYNSNVDARNAAQRLTGGLNQYGSRAGEGFENVHEQGQQRVTGDDIQNDPVLKNQQKVFQDTTMQTLGNQMGGMGLGRSGAAGQATADAWAQQATPLMQEAAAREERGLDRGINATLAASQGMTGLGQQYIGQQGQGIQGMLGAASNLNDQQSNLINQWNAANQAEIASGNMNMQNGQNWQNNNMQMLDQQFKYGTMAHDYEQQGYDSEYNDYLRRQGLAENALYTPFGQLGQTIGQKSSGGGK